MLAAVNFMTTIEIVFVSFVGAITIVTHVLNYFQKTLIERYKMLLKDYYKKLDEAYTKDNELLKYCLAQILKQSIEKEDYETAKRCQELLKQFQEAETVAK
jgi:hypothetical protein